MTSKLNNSLLMFFILITFLIQTVITIDGAVVTNVPSLPIHRHLPPLPKSRKSKRIHPTSPTSVLSLPSTEVKLDSDSPLMQRFYRHTGTKASWKLFDDDAPKEFKKLKTDLIELQEKSAIVVTMKPNSEKLKRLEGANAHFSQLVSWFINLESTSEGREWIAKRKIARERQLKFVIEFGNRLSQRGVKLDFSKPLKLNKSQRNILAKVENLGWRQATNEQKIQEDQRNALDYADEKWQIDKKMHELAIQFVKASQKLDLISKWRKQFGIR